PEGCIVENYISEESVEFCSEYLTNAEAIGLPKRTSNESKRVSAGNPLCKFLLIKLNLEIYSFFVNG
ncbi:DUF4218 domain-containing protein, partial [Proteus mirabilis]|uniref:DUF4218 domain-containing protein n=1 Tax=Proteus mirabilis TaxID=584 RepID=UPI001C1303C4